MKSINFKELIIYEDDNYIFINKPPFISSLDERNADNTSILQLARAYNSNAQLCHRLDKETTGVLVIAKNNECYKYTAVQFQNRQVDKTYHAISHGQTDYSAYDIKLPIFNAGNKNVTINFQKGKASQTTISTVKAYKNYSLLECKPLTGRMHQIRIHLSTIKHPIAGDKLYGGSPISLSDLKPGYRPSATGEQPIISRVALHARSLAFIGINNKPLSIEAPYWKDMAVALKQLDSYNALVK